MRMRSIGISLLIVVVLAGAAVAQTPRKRRNFDCLSESEVALFRHAVKVLKDRNGPKTKPPVVGSYDYYASLHNGDGVISTCNHMNELFLPWHRALLFEFERALQESDPGAGTRDLMLPYWNWTTKPSGDRIPKPFEIAGDVLFAKRGTTSATWPAGSVRYKPADIDNALRAGNWRQFGGSSCNDNPNCASASGGSFEDPYHNQMHNWIGGRSGPMADDITAAADPVFWLFHAYIDAVFAQWQAAHPTEQLTCRACTFRALPAWNPAKVEFTKDLGYEYDFTSCAPPPAALAARESAPSEPAPIALGTVAKNASAGPAIFDLKIPAAGFRSAEVKITGADIPSTFDYRGSVYLFPAKEKAKLDDETFRKRYFVGEFAVWGLHQHHPQEVALYVDATTELAYLAKTQAGSAWKIAIVVEEIQPKGEEPADLAQMKASIQFESVGIELDRGYGSQQ